MYSFLTDDEKMMALSEDPYFRFPVPDGIDFYDLLETRRINRSLYKDMDDLVRRHYFKRPPRLVIYPKDVAVIYGKSERFGRKLLQIIRDALGKTTSMPITFFEFCEYTGMDEDTVHDFIMES
jgi:hypothetical protein